MKEELLKLSNGPQLKQQKLLIVSPEMQKALYLLQLPVQELSSVIADEMEQNPLLEYTEDYEFEKLKATDDKFRELPSFVKKEGDDVKTIIENTLSYESSLYDTLLKQAKETFSSTDFKIAEILIGNIDEKGFLATPLNEISLLFDVPLEILKGVLKEIQTFDPPGVGAENVRETLLIQLERLNKGASLAFTIVKNFFDDLIQNKVSILAHKLKKSPKETQAAINEIAKLDMHPGATLPDSHYKMECDSIIPDIKMVIRDESINISVNDDKIPSLRLNHEYLKMLCDESQPRETLNYIREKISSGKWLLRNLFERHHTLYRISEEIVEKQREFFLNPKGELIPCTMKEIATKLSLHESTVARAVANKYVSCPRGVMPLRSFFTNGFATLDGAHISSVTVKDQLKELLKSENKQRPLSDEELSLKMKEKGIPCARRTIAKYRQELRVGNASQRKQHL